MRIFGRKIYGGYPMSVAKKRRIIVRGIEVILEAILVFAFTAMALICIAGAI